VKSFGAAAAEAGRWAARNVRGHDPVHYPLSLEEP